MFPFSSSAVSAIWAGTLQELEPKWQLVSVHIFNFQLHALCMYIVSFQVDQNIIKKAKTELWYYHTIPKG